MSESAANGSERIVIIGAGHGGTTCAAMLRQQGFVGQITLLEQQNHVPYDRPPLSKKLLTSQLRIEQFPLEFYQQQGIDLRLGVEVGLINSQACVIETNKGPLSYDTLIISSGASARRLALPGADLDGVFYLRTLDEAAALDQGLEGAARIVVVGAGWIGLEVAAAVRAAGRDVTVIEQSSRVLPRVASEELAGLICQRHVASGVEVVTSAEVKGFADDNQGRVAGAILADSEQLPGSAVIVGIGAIPDLELARSAGLACSDDGILVDECAQTSDAQIFAVGDVTVRPVGARDGHWRLESIPSATEQAKQAVARIVGLAPPPAEVPWFWSEQYGSKIRIAGMRIEADRTILRGDRSGAGGSTVLHLRGPEIIGVETIDAAGEFMTARKMIRDGQRIDVERLSEAETALADAAVGEPSQSGFGGTR